MVLTLSNEIRFAGISFEGDTTRCSARNVLCTLRTFAGREVFFPMRMSRKKQIPFYLRLRAQTLRGIFDRLKPSEKSEGFCVPAGAAGTYRKNALGKDPAAGG